MKKGEAGYLRSEYAEIKFQIATVTSVGYFLLWSGILEAILIFGGPVRISPTPWRGFEKGLGRKNKGEFDFDNG